MKNRKGEILRKPHGMLKCTAANYSFDTGSNLQSVVKKLVSVYNSTPKCKGLAAPQIGYLERVIVIRKGKKHIIMVNPEIVWSFLKLNSNEGCESCDNRWIVKRPSIGKVQWYDENGDLHCHIFVRDCMRVIAHEIDHLNGKMICDVGVAWIGNKIYYKYFRR